MGVPLMEFLKLKEIISSHLFMTFIIWFNVLKKKLSKCEILDACGGAY